MDGMTSSTVENDEIMDMFSDLDMGGDDSEMGGDNSPSPESVMPEAEESSDPSHENGGNVTSDTDEEVAPNSEAQQETDWEKRFKDTQRSYNEEHQKRLELEARMRALEAAQNSGQTTKQEQKEVADILKTFKDKWDDDPEDALTSVLSALDSKIEQINQSSQQRVQQDYDRQEAEARKKYSDYDNFVDDEFITALQTSEQLHKLWHENGANADAAYNLARRHKAQNEYLRTGTMPDWAKPQEPKQEAATQSKEPQTLSDVPSAPPPPAPSKHGKRLDSVADLESVLFPDS